MGPSVFHHTPIALPFVGQKLSAAMKNNRVLIFWLCNVQYTLLCPSKFLEYEVSTCCGIFRGVGVLGN